jgi:hypothetical protein
VIVVWFCFAVRDARESARWCSCNNPFKQTNLGMHNYAQAFGCLPPAYLVDRNSRPVHSWRVLLLPFVDEEEHYRRYRFDEPWNGPHNAMLADRPVYPDEPNRPLVYLCPSDWNAGKYDASQFVFTGAHTVFNGQRSATWKDFSDGTSNTALGGEMSESGIHWMEPRDLNVEEMSFRINDHGRIGLRSNHPHGVNVPLADGSVRTIRDDIDPALLKALMTIDGGEDVSGLVDY